MNRLKQSSTLWLQGGLGNQLFQLNAGLHIADQAGTPLIVSAASYRRNRIRDLSLHDLAESFDFTSTLEDLIIGPPHNRGGILRTRLGPLRLKVVQTISQNQGPGQVLVAYFQDAPSLALDTEAVRSPLIELRERLMDSRLARLIEDRPVAHVRRGDYSTAPAAIRTFGSIRPDYYLEAFEALNVRAKDAIFFTDDPSYVIDTFGIRHDQVIGPTATKNDLDGLLLMSLGKCLVIPNSTYSWWAAEVMNEPDLVVAPEEWFRDDRSGFTLARDSWKRLPN